MAKLILCLTVISVAIWLFILSYNNLDKQKSNQVKSIIIGQDFDIKELFQLNSLDNKQPIGDYRLINFFASWCNSCLEEHQELLRIANNFNNLVIYGIAFADTQDSIESFLNRYNNPYYKVFIDSVGKLAIKIGIKGVPESILVNDKNKIIYHHIGNISFELFKNQILPLIKNE